MQLVYNVTELVLASRLLSVLPIFKHLQDSKSSNDGVSITSLAYLF